MKKALKDIPDKYPATIIDKLKKGIPYNKKEIELIEAIMDKKFKMIGEV